MRIALLIASYNRREKTLECLRKVKSQALPKKYEIEIFLTDDASKDGTADAVQRLFPDVHVLHGTGTMFWAGGMRSSWQEALKKDFDYFLLLNDDTYIKSDSISKLVACNAFYLNKYSKHSITIGNTVDDRTGEISYGARKLYSKYKVKNFLVYSKDEIKECDLGDANIMFVPKEIVKKIGILSSHYAHAVADHDYTMRARKAGFTITVAPGFLGSCIYDHGIPWKSQSTRIKERLNYLYNVKGLNYRDYLNYIKRYFPLHLPEAFLKLWIKTLFPFIYEKFKKIV